jgi:hypothetical protein
MGSNPLYNALRIGNSQYNRLIKLDTPLGTDWLLPLLAKGISRLGRDYEFIVDVVTSRGSQIELKALLARPVTLWIRQLDESYLPFHGYVHRFSRLGSDGPLTYYQLRFSSWLHFLRLRRDMRDWQEQILPVRYTPLPFSVPAKLPKDIHGAGVTDVGIKDAPLWTPNTSRGMGLPLLQRWPAWQQLLGSLLR